MNNQEEDLFEKYIYFSEPLSHSDSEWLFYCAPCMRHSLVVKVHYGGMYQIKIYKN